MVWSSCLFLGVWHGGKVRPARIGPDQSCITTRIRAFGPVLAIISLRCSKLSCKPLYKDLPWQQRGEWGRTMPWGDDDTKM